MAQSITFPIFASSLAIATVSTESFPQRIYSKQISQSVFRRKLFKVLQVAIAIAILTVITFTHRWRQHNNKNVRTHSLFL